MNKGITAVGTVLIIIALILGAVQHFVSNVAGSLGIDHWYFYGAVGIIGLIGIVLAAWGLMKKKAAATPKQ